MKKIISVVIALIISVSVLSIPTFATANTKNYNPKITISKISTAPKQDGVVNNGEYGNKINSTYNPDDQFDSVYDEDKSVNADFYACWDEKNLYLAWVVHTDHHYAPDSTANMWLHSCIQFNICDRDCRDDSGLDVESLSMAVGSGSKAGKSMKVNQKQNNTELKNSLWKFTGARNDSANTTTYEVAYPWSTLDLTSSIYSTDIDNKGFHGNGGTAQIGTVIGLSYAILDTHNEEMGSDKGFWADSNATQWCAGILGTEDDGISKDKKLAIVTLGSEKQNNGSSNSSADGSVESDNGSNSDSSSNSSSNGSNSNNSSKSPQTFDFNVLAYALICIFASLTFVVVTRKKRNI